MNSLHCDCLNIQIDCDNFLPNCEIKIADYAILFSNEILPCDSFKTNLINCSLILKNDFLSQVFRIGNWLVTMCLNCSQITHAISSVNSKLNKDEKMIDDEYVIISSHLKKMDGEENFIDNQSYSRLFNILLQKPNDNNLITSDSNTNETANCLHKIQAKFDAFISEEYLQLEERIRNYETEERSNFEKLKEKVRMEKNAVIAAYLSSIKINILKKLKPKDEHSISQVVPTFPINPTKSSPTRKFKHHISDVIVEESSETENDDQMYQNSIAITTPECIVQSPRNIIPEGPALKIAYIGQLSLVPTVSNQNNDNLHDVADVFEFDGDAPYNAEPFSETDSKESDKNDTEDEGIANEKDFSAYSTSVPIHIPFQAHGPRQLQTSDSSNTFESDMATDEMMAASIQALARSVCVNDTLDIFGELPQPKTRIKLTTSLSITDDE